MSLLARLALLPLLGSLASGCAPRAFAVQPGMSHEEVISRVGKADETALRTLPPGPFSGPQEVLPRLLGAGAAYEEWIYRRGQTVRYVWFPGPVPGKPTQVIATAEYPADARF